MFVLCKLQREIRHTPLDGAERLERSDKTVFEHGMFEHIFRLSIFSGDGWMCFSSSRFSKNLQDQEMFIIIARQISFNNFNSDFVFKRFQFHSNEKKCCIF